MVAASETVLTILRSCVLFPRRDRLSPRVLIAAACVFRSGVLISLG